METGRCGGGTLASIGTQGAAKKRGLRKGNEKERPGSKEADKERGVSRAAGGDSVEQGAARVASDSSR